jgi:hypothetical protein
MIAFSSGRSSLEAEAIFTRQDLQDSEIFGVSSRSRGIGQILSIFISLRRQRQWCRSHNDQKKNRKNNQPLDSTFSTFSFLISNSPTA